MYMSSRKEYIEMNKSLCVCTWSAYQTRLARITIKKNWSHNHLILTGLKVPPIRISKNANSLSKSKTSKQQAALAIVKTEPVAARSPVIVQLRPKKGSSSSAGKSGANAPTVVRLMPKLTKTSPKNAAARSKKRSDDSSFSSKARPGASEKSRSNRRATR